jgi:ABC-type transporter Mla subunit MlaD
MENPMNEQIYNRTGLAQAGQQADGVLDQASRIGGQAANDAKAAATEAASSVASQLRSTLNGQVESGAAYLGHAASSVRTASEDLTKNAPALGNIAVAVADKLEGYVEGLKGKTADEIWADASSFTRRQPALVFGIAALAGFLAYRTIKSSGSAVARSSRGSAEEFHGA